jgi:hypothetical protein
MKYHVLACYKAIYKNIGRSSKTHLQNKSEPKGVPDISISKQDKLRNRLGAGMTKNDTPSGLVGHLVSMISSSL